MSQRVYTPAHVWKHSVVPKSAASNTFGNEPVLLGRLGSSKDTPLEMSQRAILRHTNGNIL